MEVVALKIKSSANSVRVSFCSINGFSFKARHKIFISLVIKCTSFTTDTKTCQNFIMTSITSFVQLIDNCYENFEILSQLCDIYNFIQGHPTRKNREKGLECSFLLSHNVFWPFKGYLCELTSFDLFGRGR